jgi:hypothetical protein
MPCLLAVQAYLCAAGLGQGETIHETEFRADDYIVNQRL